MSVSQYKTAEAVLREAVAGDLIEFQRLGYQHWGVYVGNGYVVHVNLASKAGTNCVISREKLVDICEGDKCRVNNLTSKAIQKGLVANDPQTIVKKAEDRVGDLIEYSLLGDNCEFFATSCRYGQAFCQQVEGKSSALVGVGTVSAIAGAAMVVIGMLIRQPGRRHQS